MSFYWHKSLFSWSVFILMTSLCVHGHYYWRCADKWSFIMTVYTWLSRFYMGMALLAVHQMHLHLNDAVYATSKWRRTYGICGFTTCIPLGRNIRLDWFLVTVCRSPVWIPSVHSSAFTRAWYCVLSTKCICTLVGSSWTTDVRHQLPYLSTDNCGLLT